jgi:transcriptional regulator GlxA family with amidase domain
MGWIIQALKQRLPEAPKIPDKRVHKVCLFIQDHYADKITLEQLAEITHVSESHLRLLFRTNLNISPMAYLQQVRLNKAKELLLLTSYPIRDIAEMVGFDDWSYFGRVFRKVKNISPNEYRKRSRVLLNENTSR